MVTMCPNCGYPIVTTDELLPIEAISEIPAHIRQLGDCGESRLLAAVYCGRDGCRPADVVAAILNADT